MNECKSCGTALLNGSASCPNCDATVAMPASVRPSPQPSDSGISRMRVSSIPDEGRFIPGTLVAGRYRIIGLLGRGGMGEVYRATDLTLAQSVALKILPEEAAANQSLLERFHAEVRIARQVSHPNVCRVYDIGEADGLPFISMEYVDGEDLGSLLHRIGRLPSDKALDVARKLCAGLNAAHERGIIHRDLKPQNIMLNKRGEVIIMDFGLAAVAQELSGSEARSGTPAYMSPEQLRGVSVTAKSDIYALGLILYELFTGQRAFEAASAAELIRLQESSGPASITHFAADVDPGVERVVLRCIQPDPAARPATALAVAAALPGGDPLAAALAAGETPSPELVAASGKTEGFAPRYATPLLIVSLLGMLLYPFVVRSLSIFALAPMDLAPEVLEHKAREIAAQLGYAEPPADWKATFSFAQGVMAEYGYKRNARLPWEQIFRTVSPVEFDYRQHSASLISPPDGEVTWTRPAPTAPGMVSVVLDSMGRLQLLRAVAPRFDAVNDAQHTPPADAVLFGLAGLDAQRFSEVAPQLAPPAPFDARRAWSGSQAGLPGIPIRVELAAWKGRIASFAVIYPWDKEEQNTGAAFSLKNALLLSTYAFGFVGVFFGVYFARLNLRRGRGDRQGAWLVGLTTFLLYVGIWLLTMHPVPSTEMIDQVFFNVAWAVGMGCVLWVLYIALEPAVRARWPQSMVTWNRVLAGQFGDPRVASHLLLGIALGVVWAYAFLLRGYFGLEHGGYPRSFPAEVLLGPRLVFAQFLRVACDALRVGLIIFFLLSGVRAVLRWEWTVALTASLLMLLTEGGIRNSSFLALDLPLFVSVYFVFCMVLLRMGLVPMISGIFVTNSLTRVPPFTGFGSWFNPIILLQLSVLIALTIYAFWRSQSTALSAPESIRYTSRDRRSLHE